MVAALQSLWSSRP